MDERIFDCGCILRYCKNGRVHGELCEAHAHSPTTKNMLLDGNQTDKIVEEIQRRRVREKSE